VKKPVPATGCPCGLGASHAVCCGRYSAPGGVAAPTAEALMRSRYSAYVLGDEVWLLASWHASTRPERLGLAEETPPLKWLGLDIVATRDGREGDAAGTVEFVARYKQGGRACRLREISRFVCEDGRWYYVDGDVDG